MNFDNKEKLAIIKILEKVAKADDKLVEEEMQILLKAARYLGVNEDLIQESKNMSLQVAGKILRNMDHDKYEFINSTVLSLMAADGVIDVVEVQTLLKAFFSDEEG